MRHMVWTLSNLALSTRAVARSYSLCISQIDISRSPFIAVSASIGVN
jgi:hypothetical protein